MKTHFLLVRLFTGFFQSLKPRCFSRALAQLHFYFLVAVINNKNIFSLPGTRVYLFARATCGTVGITCVFIAYRLIPLGDASAILFSSPVFVAILAYFILKEPLSLQQIIAGTIALLGVFIIAKPTFIFGQEQNTIYQHRLEGSALAIAGSVATAFSMILLRRLKNTPPSVIVFWFALFNLLACTALVIVLGQIVWPQGKSFDIKN